MKSAAAPCLRKNASERRNHGRSDSKPRVRAKTYAATVPVIEADTVATMIQIEMAVPLRGERGGGDERRLSRDDRAAGGFEEHEAGDDRDPVLGHEMRHGLTGPVYGAHLREVPHTPRRRPE